MILSNPTVFVIQRNLLHLSLCMYVSFSGIVLGILCQAAIALPLLLTLPMVLETMARGDLAFRIHLQVRRKQQVAMTLKQVMSAERSFDKVSRSVLLSTGSHTMAFIASSNYHSVATSYLILLPCPVPCVVSGWCARRKHSSGEEGSRQGPPGPTSPAYLRWRDRGGQPYGRQRKIWDERVVSDVYGHALEELLHFLHGAVQLWLVWR